VTKWVLGVDLGTSFSAAAIATGDRVEVLEVGGEHRVPSTVLLAEDGRLLAGTYAQRKVGQLPDRAERNPKRYVGQVPMLLGGVQVSADRALAALLTLFVDEARRRFDSTEPAKVVLTHPVAWTARQRAVLAGAAEQVLPGVEVTLVEEPVAAAVHYAHDAPEHAPGGHVAVYDLGGGTFDAAVLATDRDGFRVVGRPGGDPDIGGEVFDRLVYEHFGVQLAHDVPEWWEQVQTSPERRWLSAGADLLAEARRAKEALSAYPTTSHYVSGADIDVHLDRAELDELIGADVARTAQILAETIGSIGQAPGDLRAIYLTGGASRTPLVESTLRAAYDGLVHTWQDPKTVVALGAARWAGRAAGVTRAVVAPPAQPKTTPPRPASPAAPFPVVADGVGEAVAAAGALYVWVQPSDGRAMHRIRRIDPRTGQPQAERPFGRQLVGWAVSDAGLLLAERRGATVALHAVSPQLEIRSTVVFPSRYDPFLVVDGAVGWAFVRSSDTRTVDGANRRWYERGSGAWGEVGELAVRVVNLSGPGPSAPRSLGPTTFWFLDDNGAHRRLLDPTSPTGSVPAALGDGGACGLVMGRSAQQVPWQAVGSVGPAGEFGVVVEQRARNAEAPWVHQVLRRATPRGAVAPPWLLATSVGLETYGDLRAGRDRRLFLPRPPAGAARWVVAGRNAFGVATEHTLENRGASLHVLVDGRRRDLGRWPALLGNLAAADPADAPRIRADGDDIWLGVTDGTGSQLIRAGVGDARVAAKAPGRLEPVGRVGGSAFALHVPSAAPGEPRRAPGLLVRLPG
jgi:hypothetical protein